MFNRQVRARKQDSRYKRIGKFETLASYNFRMNPDYKHLFMKSKDQIYGGGRA